MFKKFIFGLILFSSSLSAQDNWNFYLGKDSSAIANVTHKKTKLDTLFFQRRVGRYFEYLRESDLAKGLPADFFSSFETALDSADNRVTKLTLNKSFVTTASIRDTVTADVDLEILRGGRLNLTRELLIQGSFEAGDYQIFEGNGDSVRFDGIDKVNALWWGSTNAALTIAIDVANRSNVSTLVIGDYTISSNLTLDNTSSLIFKESASFTVNSGITLTINGPIVANNNEIFFGTGLVTTRERNLNISWFDGGSFNDRWDFLTRGLVAADFYNIEVNQPYEDQNGAVELSPHGWLWNLDGPVNFDDPQQNVKFISKSVFTANTSIATAFNIGVTDAAKVNNVEFPLGLKILGNNNVGVGLRIGGVARLKFDGILAIHDADTLMYMNNLVENTSGVDIDNLYLVGYTNHALVVHGGTFTPGRAIDDINIELIECDGGDVGSSHFASILGAVRSFKVSKMILQDTFSANTSILFHIAVKHNPIYQLHFDDINANADTAFVVVDSSSGAITKVSDSIFSNIRATSGQFIGRFTYIRESEITSPSTNNNILLTNDATDMTVRLGNSYNLLTDNGTRTRINNTGINSGDPRSTGDWNSGTRHEGVIVIDNSVSGDNIPYLFKDGEWTLLSSYLTDRFSQTIADDAVHSFTSPTTTIGQVRVLVSGQSTFSGTAGFWTNTGFTGNTSIHGGGSDFEVTTGVLNGTTGTDAKVTISVNQGTVYVENRSGASRTFYISVIQ